MLGSGGRGAGGCQGGGPGASTGSALACACPSCDRWVGWGGGAVAAAWCRAAAMLPYACLRVGSGRLRSSLPGLAVPYPAPPGLGLARGGGGVGEEQCACAAPPPPKKILKPAMALLDVCWRDAASPPPPFLHASAGLGMNGREMTILLQSCREAGSCRPCVGGQSAEARPPETGLC